MIQLCMLSNESTQQTNSEAVVLDSSVWISYFTQDIYVKRAQKIVDGFLMKNQLVFIPVIIYAEVINNLFKIDKTGFFADEAKSIFNGPNFKLINLDDKFWYETIEKYSQLVRLKTLDLTILAFCFEFGIKKLYSFDEKLNVAYRFLAENL